MAETTFLRSINAVIKSAAPNRPEKPERTNGVHDGRIISMVKKNSFTASNQIKPTL